MRARRSGRCGCRKAGSAEGGERLRVGDRAVGEALEERLHAAIISAGVRDGGRLRLRGGGRSGSMRAGEHPDPRVPAEPGRGADAGDRGRGETEPPSSSCTDSATAPTRGATCSSGSAIEGRAAIAYDLPGFGFSKPVLFPRPLLDQSGLVRRGGHRVAVGEVRSAPSSSPATRSAAGPACGSPSATTCRSPGSSRSRRPGSRSHPGSCGSTACPVLAALMRVPGPVPEVVTRSVVARAVQADRVRRPGQGRRALRPQLHPPQPQPALGLPPDRRGPDLRPRDRAPVPARTGQGPGRRRLGDPGRAVPDRGGRAAGGDARGEADRGRGVRSPAPGGSAIIHPRSDRAPRSHRHPPRLLTTIDFHTAAPAEIYDAVAEMDGDHFEGAPRCRTPSPASA